LKERLILLTVCEVRRAAWSQLDKQNRRLATGSILGREGVWEQIIKFWGDNGNERRILMLETEPGMDLASGEG